MKLYSSLLTIVVVLAAAGWLAGAAFAQSTAAGESKSAGSDSDDAARRKVLESDRWRTVNREFSEWLSVQQIYRPEQVTAMKTELKKRTEKMSPRELEDFANDLEDRLHVLMSPEAEDARLWLQQFMAVARNPEQQLGRSMPDVLNMTASQIRQEIQWLERHRESRQQAHAAFSQSRASQAQTARSVQDARRTSRAPSERSAWPANAPRVRSQYSPRRELTPPGPGPAFIASPWGGPYFRPPPPPPTTR